MNGEALGVPVCRSMPHTGGCVQKLDGCVMAKKLDCQGKRWSELGPLQPCACIVKHLHALFIFAYYEFQKLLNGN